MTTFANLLLHRLDAEFEEQRNLNDAFNRLIKNMRIAYQGKNTVQAQLPQESLSRELGHRCYTEVEGSDEVGFRIMVAHSLTRAEGTSTWA